MSLPPERISVKRRRQDEPVETLYLETAPARDKKRRATDFLFRRLREDEVQDVSEASRLAEHVSTSRHDKQRPKSQHENSGIPQIRTTLPGDEVEDMNVLKAAVKANRKPQADPDVQEDEDLRPSKVKLSLPTISLKVLANARRFQLSPEHKILGPSKQHRGVRKSTDRPKTHLATFVEKGLARMVHDAHETGRSAPVDRIIVTHASAGPGQASSRMGGTVEGPEDEVVKLTLDQPFKRSSANGAKIGQSIRNHPDTWDFDSDQLASELAAFALELDSASDGERHDMSSKIVSAPTGADVTDDQEYIYETYIRLPQNATIQAEIERNELGTGVGILLIAEEDAELWEAFADSDDDGEWDEEDADSNAEDNPAFDYPEDELSSDDEFGHGEYSHRRNASDDEEYDLERDD